MANFCYLMISPDPRNPGDYAVHDGSPGFYIKIGDGSPTTGRYLSNNPSFGLAMNKNCPTKKVSTEISDGVCEDRGPGKFLEHAYLKRPDVIPRSLEFWWCPLTSQASSTDFTIDDLRDALCEQLEGFPHHNVWNDLAGGDMGESSLAELRGLEMDGKIGFIPQYRQE